MPSTRLHLPTVSLLAGCLLVLAGCSSTPVRQAAVGAPAALPCDRLAGSFTFAGTRIVSAQAVEAGQIRLPGIAQAMPAHCVVKGLMNERTGPIDGKPYAIGFEMRLPAAWNGRFFYQANGGLDGFQTPALATSWAAAPPATACSRV